MLSDCSLCYDCLIYFVAYIFSKTFIKSTEYEVAMAHYTQYRKHRCMPYRPDPAKQLAQKIPKSYAPATGGVRSINFDPPYHKSRVLHQRELMWRLHDKPYYTKWDGRDVRIEIIQKLARDKVRELRVWEDSNSSLNASGSRKKPNQDAERSRKRLKRFKRPTPSEFRSNSLLTLKFICTVRRKMGIED